MTLNTGIYRPDQLIKGGKYIKKMLFFISLKKCKLLEFCLDDLFFLPSRRGQGLESGVRGVF